MPIPQPGGLAALTAAAAARSNSMVAARLSNEAAIKGTYATLDLGAPQDGRSWEEGCARLGMTARTSVINDRPSLHQLAAVFATPVEWVYLSGHFLNMALFSEQAAEVEFFDDAVEVSADGAIRRLTKAAGGFQLQLGCKLLVWGGCSTLKYETRVRSFRTLFKNPVMLGYAAATGWRINDAMLGGGFITNDFFSRVRNKTVQNDRDALRNAWMETANWGYGGGDYEDKFRAIDADGQEWLLSRKTIVKGRKF